MTLSSLAKIKQKKKLCRTQHRVDIKLIQLRHLFSTVYIISDKSVFQKEISRKLELIAFSRTSREEVCEVSD